MWVVMSAEDPDVCSVVSTSGCLVFLHFVYFDPSKIKVRVNLRYQVFQACVVHEHVQIQLLCN